MDFFSRRDEIRSKVNNMKKAIYYFISGTLLVIFGLMVIICPSAMVNVAATLFSAVLLVRGVRTLINTLRFDKVAEKVIVNGVEINLDSRRKVRTTMLINALLSALLGLVAFVASLVALLKGSSGIMKIMVYVVASGFLLSALAGFVENRRMREWEGMEGEIGEKSLFLLVVALILFVFPSLIGNVFMNILGALITAFGALFFAWGVYLVKAQRAVAGKKAEDAVWKEKES